jgi:hypothetical protein
MRTSSGYVVHGTINLPDGAPARRAVVRLTSVRGFDPKGSARAHVYLANPHVIENQPAEAIAELDAYLAAATNAPDRDKLLALESQLRAAVRK